MRNRKVKGSLFAGLLTAALGVGLLAAGCGAAPASPSDEESTEIGITKDEESVADAQNSAGGKDEAKANGKNDPKAKSTTPRTKSANAKKVKDQREERNGKKVGAGDPSKVEADMDYKNCVRVSNIEEFYDAFADDTQIILEEGTYNFSELSEPYYQASAKDENEIGNFYAAAYPLLRIDHVKIQGEGRVEIVIEDAYDAVFSVMGCDDVVLENLTFGHEVEPGYCSGSVILCSKSQNVTIQNCDMYGCGTYGLEAYGSSVVTVKDSIIHDCSYGITFLSGDYYVNFDNCILRDSIGIGNIFDIINTSVARFKDCEIIGNRIDQSWSDIGDLPLVESYQSDAIEFKRCIFKDNEYGRTSNGDGILFENCEFEYDRNNAEKNALGTFDRRGGEACDPDELAGRWILTDGEVEGDHWYASKEGMVGEILIEEKKDSLRLKSFSYHWNDGAGYQSFENAPLKEVDEPVYTGCSNNDWRVDVEVSTIEETGGKKKKLDPKWDGYAATLVDENTLLWQTFFEFDGGPGVSYMTFHRYGMVGNNDEGWYTVDECAPIKKRIEEAPKNARFLVIAGAESEGIEMLGCRKSDYNEEYLFMNLTDDPYYYGTAGTECEYNEEKEDFDYSLYQWTPDDTFDEYVIPAHGVEGAGFSAPEGMPNASEVFVNTNNGEKLFWPISWLTGRQGGACLYITDEILYSKKMKPLDMTKPAQTVFAGYLYAYPDEEYDTEPGLPLRDLE